MFGFDLLDMIVIGFILLAVVVVAVIVVVFATRGSRDGEVPRAPAAEHLIEARLHELEGLRARGVISYDEYVAARQRAIDGLSA
jgi:uncharacterized membrane protein